MALLHVADLTPSKLELVRAWIPSQPWWTGPADSAELAGAYRFDDPAGEVGIETHLLRAADGSVVQVPTTYRAAPLADADRALIGTLEHSVLGTRWVYDGCYDPVFVEALATAIATGGAQAELQVQSSDGALAIREATTRVQGSGTDAGVDIADSVPAVSTDQIATTIQLGQIEVTVQRVIDSSVPSAGRLSLTGTWPGNDQPAVLAQMRVGG
jgi:hypothetical protein